MRRLNSSEEADLKWFFEGPDGSFGLKSSFAALQNQLRAGTLVQNGAPDEQDADRMFRVLGRFREIERVLRRMPRSAVRVLKRWVMTSAERIERTHPGLRAAIGEEVRALPRAKLDEASTVLRDKDRRRLVDIRNEAAGMIAGAVEHWRQASPNRRHEN